MQPPYKAYSTLTPVVLSEFGDFFTNFETEAFRLELLPLYTVPEEAQYFEQYAEDKPCPKDLNEEWLTILSVAATNGRKFTRVRYLGDGPLTPYLKFETDWGYRQSIKRGENILVLKAEDFNRCAGMVPILNDYWLFDRKTCFIMFYDAIGQFLGVQKTPPAICELYAKLSERLKTICLPFNGK